MHPLVEDYGDCGLDEEIEAGGRGGGETRVVECGDGELVGVSGGGEEREVVRSRW